MGQADYRRSWDISCNLIVIDFLGSLINIDKHLELLFVYGSVIIEI